MAQTIRDILLNRPTSVGVDNKIEKANTKIDKNSKTEFDSLLQEASEEKGGLKFSTHAMKRLDERSIQMDSEEFVKLRGALDKLKSKGGKDSLVLTGKAAYIMDVPNNTVVTAMEKSKLAENVFTKIDSTLILD